MTGNEYKSACGQQINMNYLRSAQQILSDDICNSLPLGGQFL